MAYEHEMVEVAVRNRTLWVGSEAYPLHNIARVQAREWEPDRREAKRAYLWSLVKLAVGTFVALFFVACLGSGGGDEGQAAGGFAIGILLVVAIVLVVRTVRLKAFLAQPNLYALMVETAGSPHAALISDDRAQVVGLVQQVVEAIDNPAKEFALNMQVVHGDNVQGDKVFGDKVGRDKLAR